MSESLGSPGWHWERAWAVMAAASPCQLYGHIHPQQHLRGDQAQQGPGEMEEGHKANICPPPWPGSLLLLHTCLLLSLCLPPSHLLLVALSSSFLLCLLYLYFCQEDMSVCGPIICLSDLLDHMFCGLRFSRTVSAISSSFYPSPSWLPSLSL